MTKVLIIFVIILILQHFVHTHTKSLVISKYDPYWLLTIMLPNQIVTSVTCPHTKGRQCRFFVFFFFSILGFVSTILFFFFLILVFSIVDFSFQFLSSISLQF